MAPILQTYNHWLQSLLSLKVLSWDSSQTDDQVFFYDKCQSRHFKTILFSRIESDPTQQKLQKSKFLAKLCDSVSTDM